MNNSIEAMDDSTPKDNVDARGIFGKTKTLEATGIILGSLDSEDYSMNYPQRGKCYIFNHKTFEPFTGLNVRNGTDADAARLYCRFRELQFDVTIFTDLRVKEVEKELQKVNSEFSIYALYFLKKTGKEDHTDYSCFICCILSHGGQDVLYAADGEYKTERVFAPFRGDACPSLAGKPKIFFLQACQGDKLDYGVKVTRKESTDSGDDKQTLRIPTHADFLIMFSTVPGFYSWRNTTNGSWFVQSLCAALQKHAYDMDLLQILTAVNRRVAYDFESFTPLDSTMHRKKQVPFVTSTLTKNIRFPPS
ncbi:caspase-7 [Caerostris extrusa]|uniref:Caspase-7 n=1 Tax=Caerostris extrusa TaxID=172846 RepID=A0AAV4V6B5_CAEEX|nr:caspase-7 [Caerostris extrusa]